MENEVFNDYMLVIHPDAQTLHDISIFRHLISEELGIDQAAFSQAHIALFRSEFPEKYEADFISMVEEMVQEQSAFTIYTSRIDHSKQGDSKHLFYVNVANPKPVEELHKKIMHTFEVKPGTFRPHIALARAVNSQQFNQLAPYFANKMFVRSFHCHSFSLLKKQPDGRRYEVVREFQFGKDNASEHPLFTHAA
ncbi:2'-5' RNA ligase family protein [Chitinophaga lutea]|uniref:2'-5' RNA ligase family protein n=1 Tax=Chitinophaga lutea TaxID=2488634 RepID=A0A3N4PLH3_9BACT|nr:2'-5' RNA ligase family protein [Chitinophaga lutea]RPE09066.1 2'-5' RNA ligase family protein [Chitinophaga lutea]